MPSYRPRELRRRPVAQSTNLRTPFLRILRKAKVKPWTKLFQNQRSSRETELLKEFPVHVVCAWLGNTPRVALKHYAQVTDEAFKKATRGDSKRQAG